MATIKLIRKKGVNPQTKEVLYYPRWTREDTIQGDEVAEKLSRGATFMIGETLGLLYDFPKFIEDELLQGNAVKISGLGTFKLRVEGESKKVKEEVNTKNIHSYLVFEADAKLEDDLNSKAKYKFTTKITEEGLQDVGEDDTSANAPVDTSTDVPVDTSTGDTPVDTSTNTVDTSTGSGSDNGGSDLPPGNG